MTSAEATMSQADGSDTQAAHAVVHPESEDIRRQVEYYFSDENLPCDEHLLALTGGDGNGKVKLKTILGFPKMRRFKPKLQVVAALRQSQLIEIIDNQWVQRKQPLNVPLQVEPKLKDPLASRMALNNDKPWLTKGMLKPTGFEPDFVEGPTTPADFAIEKELFSADNSFVCRIETAINRYCRNRKMHQTTRNIFVKFMSFGGIEGGQGPFTSGTNKKQLKKEGYDADEIDRMLVYFTVSDAMLDALDKADSGSQVTLVDFEQLAKAFLSTKFMTSFEWDNVEMIETACNVLRNFYNYLLYHDVCPEYHQQLLNARAVCDDARDELSRLIIVEKSLPGSFNISCSILYDGAFAGLYRAQDAPWHSDVDNANVGYSREQALAHFRAGVYAYEDEHQMTILETADRQGKEAPFNVAYEEDMGLEVVRAEGMTDAAATIYNSRLAGSRAILPMGLLVCKRWQIHYESKSSIPDDGTNPFPSDYEITLIAEQATLDSVVPGMKLDAKIKQFDNGILFMDQLYSAHPSFFTWVGNDLVQSKKKAPGSIWPRDATEAEPVEGEEADEGDNSSNRISDDVSPNEQAEEDEADGNNEDSSGEVSV